MTSHFFASLAASPRLASGKPNDDVNKSSTQTSKSRDALIVSRSNYNFDSFSLHLFPIPNIVFSILFFNQTRKLMRTSLLPTSKRLIIFSSHHPISSSPKRFQRMSADTPSETAQAQKSANMITSTNASDLGIESTDIKTATGVSLGGQQKLIVGSVLDVRILVEKI